ncbi:hypothetical protein D1BOALGB6SA_9654 [Olavius sp. associated proteobacterium Delta 1]|nr:hypothetical protein D1BOALGB6SA_9654 [Olavius sp. associated proteobacterium Delta 1]
MLYLAVVETKFILTLKSWSNGHGQSRLEGLHQSNVLEYWNIGVLE